MGNFFAIAFLMFRGKWDIIAGMEDDFRALEFRNGELVLIDQRLLPGKLEYVSCQKSEEVAYAISAMIVRGAPAIGGAAGFGVYLAAREARGDFDLFSRKAEHIKSARPTAVNLAWAVDEMVREAREHGLDVGDFEELGYCFEDGEMYVVNDEEENPLFFVSPLEG